MSRSTRQYEQIRDDELHLEPMLSQDYSTSRAGLSDDYYFPNSNPNENHHGSGPPPFQQQQQHGPSPAPFPGQPHYGQGPAPLHNQYPHSQGPSPVPSPAPKPTRPPQSQGFGVHAAQHHQLTRTDRKLKTWIRFLKFVSRILALVLSITSFVPVVMTIQKFLATKDTYYSVNGTQRTAWPTSPNTWYSYMYAAVNLVSMVLNIFIILSYCRGIKHANKVDNIAGWWSMITTGAQIVFYAAAVIIYRYGKEPVNGHFKDLWGWTCSPAASQIQASILDVNFGQYCSIQSFAFDTGAANVATAILSAIIYLFSIMRLRQKRQIGQVTRVMDAAMIPLTLSS